MDGMSMKVLALISTLTVMLVGALKKAFPKWVGGKEELLSIVLPVIGVLIAKLAGAFHGADWLDAMMAAIGSGLVAGVAHDKIVNPLMAGKNAANGAPGA